MSTGCKKNFVVLVSYMAFPQTKTQNIFKVYLLAKPKHLVNFKPHLLNSTILCRKAAINTLQFIPAEQ